MLKFLHFFFLLRTLPYPSLGQLQSGNTYIHTGRQERQILSVDFNSLDRGRTTEKIYTKSNNYNTKETNQCEYQINLKHFKGLPLQGFNFGAESGKSNIFQPGSAYCCFESSATYKTWPRTHSDSVKHEGWLPLSISQRYPIHEGWALDIWNISNT